MIIASFLIVNLRNATHLTFVWEEWYHLLAIFTGPLEGLTWGGSGYLSLLGNAIFMVETQLFGMWYVGYVAVNAVILSASVVVSYVACPPAYRWVFVGFSGLLLFSASSLFTVGFGNEIGDLLSILFGACAIGVYRRTQSCRLAFPALALSVIANNLVGLVTAATVFGVVTYSIWQRGLRLRCPAFRSSVIYLFSLPVLFATILALLDVALLESPVSVMLPETQTASATLLSQVVTAFTFLVYWIFVPLLPTFLSVEERYLDWLMEFLARPYAAVLGGFFVLMALFWTRKLSGVIHDSKGPSSFWWGPLVLLSGAGFFAVLLAFMRAENPYDLRFALYWLPSVLAFLGVLVVRLVRLSRVLAVTSAGVILIANACAIWIALVAPSEALDLVRPRTSYSMQVIADLSQCPGGDLPRSVSEIATGLSWDEVCKAYLVVVSPA